MVGMLKQAFRQHPIPGRNRIFRQLQIFFMHLLGCTTNATLWAIAVVILIAVATMIVTTVVVVMAPATPTTIALIIGTLSHGSCY